MILAIPQRFPRIISSRFRTGTTEHSIPPAREIRSAFVVKSSSNRPCGHCAENGKTKSPADTDPAGHPTDPERQRAVSQRFTPITAGSNADAGANALFFIIAFLLFCNFAIQFLLSCKKNTPRSLCPSIKFIRISYSVFKSEPYRKNLCGDIRCFPYLSDITTRFDDSV